jgi:hypothetical protein
MTTNRSKNRSGGGASNGMNGATNQVASLSRRPTTISSAIICT